MSTTISYNSTSNISAVTFSDGVHVGDITLHFSGNYTQSSFQFVEDANGGTIVELAPIDEWINAVSSLWSTGSNWSDGTPPGEDENVAVDAPGTYTVTSTTDVDINNLFVAAGATILSNPGTVFDVDGNLVNNGNLNAGPFSSNHISIIDIEGDVSGTGAINISNKAVVEIGGSVAGQIVNGAFSGTTVTFQAGQGELILDHSANFHGLISGTLSSNNLIDLKDLTFTSSMSDTVNYDATLNISTVTFNNGTTSVSLMFSGHDTNWSFATDSGGGTIVADPPPGSALTINSGTTLDVSAASADGVSFVNDVGTNGTLVLQDSKDFGGIITGFSGDGTLANSDAIDLQDINFAKLTTETYVENAAGSGGTLTLSDGTNTANINFSGDYVLENFKFQSDGQGGTLLVDPPVPSASNGSVDQFVFTPATGPTPVQHTLAGFDANLDMIDLRLFGNIVKSASDLI